MRSTTSMFRLLWMGEESYAASKKLDEEITMGKGEVFRTKTGELSVRATELDSCWPRACVPCPRSSTA